MHARLRALKMLDWVSRHDALRTLHPRIAAACVARMSPDILLSGKLTGRVLPKGTIIKLHDKKRPRPVQTHLCKWIGKRCFLPGHSCKWSDKERGQGSAQCKG